MGMGPFGNALRQLRIQEAAAAIEFADADLLERFRNRLDADAFAVLVQRHGPLVLAVCRRILHDPNDADDAFQATFLVLARKAHTIRNTDSVVGWLHGVATRLAARHRADAARRRRHERQAAMHSDAVDTTTLWPELGPLLDEG